ncbi:unnamed protein product [Rotaria sordida]|uniref:Uncharacterized protein n=1 Tax=Rotaria sordida TaxID=392033 RepID=A0A815D7I9_9BILA|nr:unnamed protein product [Rotaria sordida]
MLQIIAELFSARTLHRDDDDDDDDDDDEKFADICARTFRRDNDDDDEKFADVWFVNKEWIKMVSDDYKRKIDKVL